MASNSACEHINAIDDGEAPETSRVRRVRQDACPLGAPADVPGMRLDAVLRQLTQSARIASRAKQRTRRDRVGGAGRALAVLLSGRRVRGVPDPQKTQKRRRREGRRTRRCEGHTFCGAVSRDHPPVRCLARPDHAARSRGPRRAHHAALGGRWLSAVAAPRRHSRGGRSARQRVARG